MPILGEPRWAKRPKYCAGCFGVIRTHRGGAEIDRSPLFADARASTELAEQMAPKAFDRLMVSLFPFNGAEGLKVRFQSSASRRPRPFASFVTPVSARPEARGDEAAASWRRR